MSRRLNKVKKSIIKNLSADYTLRAPPCDKYSVFQPGDYARLYHHCEEAKMKRSYQWVYSDFKAEELNKKLMNKKTQEEILPVKTCIEKRILPVEIGVDYNKKILLVD